MNIDLNWKYKDAIENIEVLKSYYKDVITSFLYFDLRKKVKFQYKIKQQVYSLNFEMWKRDKIWEYLNDYVEFESLKRFI